VYLSNKTLLCHPDVFLRRYRNETYIGLNQSKKEIKEKFHLITSKEPYFITKDVCFLGEVNPRETKYVLDDGSKDYIPDDSALAIHSEDGIIVITGCSHAGILNIIEKSKEVFSEDKIHAVIGGFHLKEINSKLDVIVEGLKNINHIYTGHCTSQQVMDYLNKKGLKVNQLSSLMTIEI
jgi:7,8-dihydropterin-6-yl-methyl-4-(beta-D-ribofuranosyl)aminobenzene 5'-phosphate synthase